MIISQIADAIQQEMDEEDDGDDDKEPTQTLSLIHICP